MKRSLLTLCLWSVGSQSLAKDILIVRRDNEITVKFSQHLQKNLQKQYTVGEYIYEQSSTKSDEEFRAVVQKENPRLLILLDNKAVAMAKRYYQDHPDAKSKFPSVATLGLNFKNLIDSTQYPMAGIAYEISGFSLVTQFRYVFDLPIKKVLVLYRGKNSLKSLIDDAQKQLARENIQLIPKDLDLLKADSVSIEDALQKELIATHDGQAIEAVWVFADNTLLQSHSLIEVWERKAQALKVPFLCTVEQVLEKFKICSFAVFPSHDDLADQTAEMSRSILEDGLTPKDIGVEYVITSQAATKKGLIESLGLKIVEERSSATLVRP